MFHQLNAVYVENIEIAEVCTTVLDAIGRRKSVDNLRRQLKKYYKAQLQRARLPLSRHSDSDRNVAG